MENSLQSFRDYLSSKGLKLTRQRKLILKVFLSLSSNVTAEQLFHEMQHVNDTISRSTVYRTIRHLQNAGIARCIHVGDCSTRYESAGELGSFLLCERCGKKIPLINPYIDCLYREAARQHGFDLYGCQSVIRGLCHECSNKSGTNHRSSPEFETHEHLHSIKNCKEN